jgi:hypothetical protein
LYYNYTQNLRYKYNKNMLKGNSNDLKQREVKTLKRIKSAQRSAVVLGNFFEKGFKNYPAFSAIVLNYHPEITDSRLWDFWHFRVVDEEICGKIEDVFEKLNHE